MQTIRGGYSTKDARAHIPGVLGSSRISVILAAQSHAKARKDSLHLCGLARPRATDRSGHGIRREPESLSNTLETAVVKYFSDHEWCTIYILRTGKIWRIVISNG